MGADNQQERLPLERQLPQRLYAGLREERMKIQSELHGDVQSLVRARPPCQKQGQPK